MKGAIHWQAVGDLYVGSFLDATGKPCIAIKGHARTEHVDKIISIVRAITACIENSPTRAQEGPQQHLIP